MIRKILKAILCGLVLMTTVCSAFLLGTNLFKPVYRLETEESRKTNEPLEYNDSDQIHRSIITESKASFRLEEDQTDFVINHFEEPCSLNGIGLSVGKNDVRIYDEKTGEETVVYASSVNAAAFNGQTIVFTVPKEDPAVKINPNLHDEMGNPYTPTSYIRADVMSYDLSGGKTQKVFTAYGNVYEIHYFDSSEIYYLDVLESQMGYYNHTWNASRNLCCYSFKTGKISVVATEINSYESVTTICAGDRHFLLMYGMNGSTKLYDIKEKKLIELTKNRVEYQWFHDGVIYFISNSYEKKTIYVYSISDGSFEKLFSTYNSFVEEKLQSPRYILCGAETYKEDSLDGTVEDVRVSETYYDLKTRETFDFQGEVYQTAVINGVQFASFKAKDGEYILTYLDDNHKNVFIETLPADYDYLDTQNEFGYYKWTNDEETDRFDNMKYVFFPFPMSFFEDLRTLSH